MLHSLRNQKERKVLFVDDDEILVEMNICRLESMGCNVTASTDSLEALEIFQAAPNGFDLIITDQRMPNMTGIELAKKIKGIRPDIPIILLTGLDDAEAMDKGLQAGISACAPKVICEQDMAELVDEVLTNRAIKINAWAYLN